jgi:hypothetical protein
MLSRSPKMQGLSTERSYDEFLEYTLDMQYYFAVNSQNLQD